MSGLPQSYHEARAQVEQLVERFARNLDAYKCPDYKEAHVRVEFITEYPAIERYLGHFKEWLMPKPKGWKGSAWKGRKLGSYQWYEIQDAIDYYAEFEKPKISAPSTLTTRQTSPATTK